MHKSIGLVLASAAAAAAAAFVFAGPLDPPTGPVAPSYKTLADIEPRTAIQSLAGSETARYVISRPGSYYLTADIIGVPNRSCIEVHAGNVTIDLNGFSLIGVAGSLDGVWAPGGPAKPSICVRNGAVTGWGEHGVDLGLHAAARIENLRAVSNGLCGVLVGAGGVISHCEARGNGFFGIWASDRTVISHSTSTANTDDGLRLGFECIVDHVSACGNVQDGVETLGSAVISDSTASGNSQIGFRIGDNSTITNCTANANAQQGVSGGSSTSVHRCIASHNSASGIFLQGAGNTISDCVVRSNQRDGIRVFNTSIVTGCTADLNALIHGNNHAGIRLIGNANRAEGNNICANDIGLRIDGQGNLVVRNNFSYNPVRINAEPGNNCAQMIVVPGADFISTDPWANFAH